jgi:hypothetical protein
VFVFPENSFPKPASPREAATVAGEFLEARS